jgi:phosphoglycolate phosphatase-like HAD superfamily hydrolase
MTSAVVVLDLDGVIVKTNLVKHDAMLSLFADYPDRQSSMSAFILENGGVPRKVKLAALLQEFLNVTPTERAIEGLLARYAKALEHRLAIAPTVEGVEHFVASWPGPRYVCSSAPESEVHEQVSRLSLQTQFTAVYGGDTPKSEALRQIAAANPERSVVFFGDSIGDYEAAVRAKVGFVAVACERDNFENMPVVKIRDFANQAILDRAMRVVAA